MPGVIIQRPQRVSQSYIIVFSRGAKINTKLDCSELINRKCKISTFFQKEHILFLFSKTLPYNFCLYFATRLAPPQ